MKVIVLQHKTSIMKVYPDLDREQCINWYEYCLHAGQHECSSSGTRFMVLFQVLNSYKCYCFQHTMEVIKVEPDLDTESLNRSPFYEGPHFDETEDQDQDPLLIESAEVKQEVKVSVLLVHALCKRFCKDSFSYAHVTLLPTYHFTVICKYY